MFDRRRRGHRLVCDRFHRHDISTPEEPVGRDQELRVAVPQPGSHRFGAEPGKQRSVDRADLAAGQDSRNRFRGHRHEYADDVAPLDPEVTQHVGEAVGLGQQVAEGDRPLGTVVTLPDQRRPVAPRSGGMTIERVRDVVETTIDEPLGPRRALRQVHHCRVRRREIEAEILDDRAPVPPDVFGRPSPPRIDRVDAVLCHECQESAAFAVGLGRGPGEVGIRSDFERHVLDISRDAPHGSHACNTDPVRECGQGRSHRTHINRRGVSPWIV